MSCRQAANCGRDLDGEHWFARLSCPKQTAPLCSAGAVSLGGSHAGEWLARSPAEADQHHCPNPSVLGILSW